MIHFNELRYSRNNNTLIVDTAIDSLDYYNDVYIDSIVIDNQDTYIENGPSSNPLYSYKVPEPYLKVYSLPQGGCSPIKTNDGSYCFIYDLLGKKLIRLEIPTKALNIDPTKDILFVYVIATGTPSPDTPCGFDNGKIIGTVVDLKKIYTSMISSLREVEYNCSIPKYFIDNILKYKALELAIRTGNYLLAIKYWRKFFQELKPNTTIKCKCYGNN